MRKSMKNKLLGLALLGLAVLAASAHGQITVAAAADLNPAFNEIVARYHARTGKTVRLSFGSSGNLFTQIENGAPFDLFFSADLDYPSRLIADRFADASSLHPYAVGQLVLWIPASSSLPLDREGMNVLLDPSVKKIAIANPQHAPYGRAAVAALRHFGLYEKIEGRLVLGENVAQAAQFVESGNAQAGIVALSHALAPAMKNNGRYWKVPADAYPALKQGAVIVSHSHHKQDAADFLAYLRTPEAAGSMRRYGLSPVEDKP
jgi:molybdate transport system substrate-binding protein